MNFLHSLGMEVGSFVEDGQFLMLFMVALLLLWLAGDENRKEFRQFALVMLLILLCPISAKLLLVYQTRFYGYEDLWELLPVTALLAYGLVMASMKIIAARAKEYGRWKAEPKRKEYSYEIFMTLVLTALLFLCGTLTPAKAVTVKASGMDGIPGDVKEVLVLLDGRDEEQITILAPDEIAAWARIYDGDILLPYGRSLWEPELAAYTYDTYTEDMQELHAWVNGSLPLLEIEAAEDADISGGPGEDAVSLEETFLSRCASHGYEYLIFSTERESEASLQTALDRQNCYTLYDRTEEYVIYGRSDDYVW